MSADDWPGQSWTHDGGRWSHPSGASVVQAIDLGAPVYYALTSAGQSAVVEGDAPGVPIIVCDEYDKQKRRTYRWGTLQGAQDAAQVAMSVPLPLAGRLVAALALVERYGGRWRGQP